MDTKVHQIQWSILSASQIKRLSVVEISNSCMYCKSLPNLGGLQDHRMGTLDRRYPCATCMNSMESDLGHPGIICLATPVYHPLFLTTILKCLRCLCYFCARLKSDLPVNTTINEKQRFNWACTAISSVSVCCHCNRSQPKYRKTRECSIRLTWENSGKRRRNGEPTRSHRQCFLTPQDVYDIFKFAPEEDLRKMGFDTERSHPKNMILKVLLVPPPAVRPAISIYEGSKTRGQDDLTLRLSEILKTNADILKSSTPDSSHRNKYLPTGGLTPADAHQLALQAELQLNVASYMSSDKYTQPSTDSANKRRNSKRALKSLAQRLKGKYGRVRYNLMGKRVDFSARSVITPDTTLDLDEVGLPAAAAVLLTRPERVTAFNHARLAKTVQLGPGVLGGAESILLLNGKQIKLEPNSVASVMQIGSTVNRYLQDGDLVIINRQPTLHRSSIMAHRVKIMSGSTIRLNLAVVGPYNADFDGDEMNIHVPQTLEAYAEASELMAVSKHIISPQNNRATIQLIQDALIGLTLLTEPNTFLTKAEMCNAAMHMKYSDGMPLPPPAIQKPVTLWSGYQLFSLMLPNDFSYSSKEHNLFIYKGDLVRGTLTKDHLGSSAHGLIYALWEQYGEKLTIEWVSDVQRVANEFLSHVGFTIGMRDCLISNPKKAASIKSMLSNAVHKMVDLQNHVARIHEETGVAHSIEPVLKMMSQSILNRIGGKINALHAEHASSAVQNRNHLADMIFAGSKGNIINLTQIQGTVGQQCLSGRRLLHDSAVSDSFSSAVHFMHAAQLPCFHPSDNSPRAHGLVCSSYVEGLDMDEFFMHTMAGREGLVDTSVKTATTGYIHHRLAKATENICIAYDKSVRSHREQIVSFSYGADGFASQHCHRVAIPFHFIETSSQLRMRLPIQKEELEELENLYRQLRSAKSTCTHVPMSIDPERLWMQVLDRPPRWPSKVQGPFLLWAGRHGILQEQLIADLRTSLENFNEYPALIYTVRCWTSSFFCEANMVTEPQFRRMAQSMLDSCCKAKAEAGEMVGLLAAESIGEPITQMTLNTFHYAGINTKQVTSGVPRIKELIDLARVIKTPAARVAFTETVHTLGAPEQERLFKSFEAIFLAHVVSSFACIKERLGTVPAGEPDKAIYLLDRPFIPKFRSQCIRIELNKSRLLQHHLLPADVARIVMRYLKKERRSQCHIVYSQPSMDKWLIKLWVNTEEPWTDCDLERLFREIPLAGIRDIKKMNPPNPIPSTGSVVVHANGSNLRKLWDAPYVDFCSTISNDIFEVLELLGLEAALAILFQEILAVLTADGKHVDHRHIDLLVNAMSFTGSLRPINRHGMNKSKTDPLDQCTFEETIEILSESCIYAKRDRLRGVSSNIILGQLAPAGTGLVHVISPVKAEPSLSSPQFDRSKDEFLQSSSFSSETYDIFEGHPLAGWSMPEAGKTIIDTHYDSYLFFWQRFTPLRTTTILGLVLSRLIWSINLYMLPIMNQPQGQRTPTAPPLRLW